MDDNIKWFYQTKAKMVMEALKANRINSSYLADASQVAGHVLGLIAGQASVAVGGSMTLTETGLLEAIRQADVRFIDRYEPGLGPDETMARLRAGLDADVFVSGVNAITEDGQLVFVDGNCNRVAGVLFGPRKVILVAGCNKICADVTSAIERVNNYAAPINAKRLGRKTPCVKTGVCEDCRSPERICNATVIIHKQADPQRMHVVLVGADLGY